MENTEKVIQNDNKEKSVHGKFRRNFRPRKRVGNNKNTKEQNPRHDTQVSEVKTSSAPQRAQERRVSHTTPANKPKDTKKPLNKDVEPLDFTIGEFEENGKKYAFKMLKRVYHIVEIVEETEKEIFKTEDSKTAYFEWCKIKYPEKVKKGMV